MKKIFAFMAVALVAFSFASCDKKNEPQQKKVTFNVSEDVRFDDAVATDGWWQIQAQDSTYYVTLSNSEDIEISQAAGTYTVADLDPDYSFIYVLATKEKIAFTEGSVTLTVSADGKQATLKGTLTGADSVLYELNILYTQPEAKKTVNVNIENGQLYEGYGAYGLWAFYGQDANAYVQLALWADELSGEFTEEDLDNSNLGSFVEDADGESQIYTAAITITPGNGEDLQIVADLLCYNNTLYKVTMVTPAPAADDEEEAAPVRKAAKKVAFKGAKRTL